MSTNDRTSLPDWFTALPQETQKAYAAALHTFAHDIRQPLAQIHSAEELLRRGLAAGKGEDDLIELLDIVREANSIASHQVDAFIETYLIGIEPPDPSTL